MIKIYESNEMFEMTNLSRKRTKLPFNIWVQINTDERHKNPRCKFQCNKSDRVYKGELVPVEISKDPKFLVDISSIKNFDLSKDDVKLGFDYIKRNFDIIIKYWNQDIDDDELKDILRDRGDY